jgi:hypothetical protein
MEPCWSCGEEGELAALPGRVAFYRWEERVLDEDGDAEVLLEKPPVRVPGQG